MGQMSNRKARVSLPEPDFPAREEKIQQTIRAAEQSLLDAQAREPMGMGEFFASQVRYVRKRWWLLQTLLLAALYWYVVNQTQAMFIRQALGTGGTILIVLAIPELWKNLAWGAMDIEFASMYTIRQVYCVRLILLSGVDLILIMLFCLAASAGDALAIWDLMVQFIIPVNVTACICLTCLYFPKVKSQAFPLALSLCFSGLWQRMITDEIGFQSISADTWTLGLTVSVIYLCICVKLGQQRLGKGLDGAYKDVL